MQAHLSVGEAIRYRSTLNEQASGGETDLTYRLNGLRRGQAALPPLSGCDPDKLKTIRIDDVNQDTRRGYASPEALKSKGAEPPVWAKPERGAEPIDRLSHSGEASPQIRRRSRKYAP